MEVLNDHGDPCEPGETGRVVMTNLVNTYAPLIRYELGDLATVGEPCRCGRGYPTLASVEGKIHPLFVLPNGAKKNSIGLAIELRKIGGARQFQVIQQTSGITLNIIRSHQWCSQLGEEIHTVVHQFFEAKIPVELRFVDRIPLYAGKRRHLICQLDG